MIAGSDAIAARRGAWVAAVRAGDLDAYCSLFTDDIVWFPPGTPAVQGAVAMREWLEPFFDRYAYDFSLELESLTGAGDHAVEVGRFVSRMTTVADGRTSEHSGRYLVLWRRRPEGWKIDRYVDITKLEERPDGS